jgi:8-oxo-dGTP diphosphatase
MNEVKLFVAVKVCIVNDTNEVLLLRESGEYADGTHVAQYDIPGGRISPGEMLDDALTREVFEETGLAVTAERFIDVRDTMHEKRGETWHIVRLFYVARYQGGDVVLSQDHDNYKWVKIQDLESTADIIDELLPVLTKLS